MIHILINGVDVSSFVISCDRIPVAVRNRDFSPIAEGFSFRLSINSYLAHRDIGTPIVVRLGATPFFLGEIKRFVTVADDNCYEIDVQNALYKLEKLTVSYDTLHSSLLNLSTVPGSPCTFDPVPNTVYSVGHNLYDNHGVVFETTGVLPLGIVARRVYYVTRVNADYFKVREYSESISDILLITAGEGSHTYKYVSQEEYVERDNFNSPNVRLSWLFKRIFHRVGLMLDISNVEYMTLATIPVEGTNYNFNLYSLCMDEYMLYCLNQRYAMHYSLIDDPGSRAPFSTSKISLWKLFCELCSSFGFCLRVHSETPFTYRLVKNTVLLPYTASNALSYSEELIKAPVEEGYTTYYNHFRGRLPYMSETEQELPEFGKSVVGEGVNEVTVLSNFRVLLRDPRPGAFNGKTLSSFDYEFPFHLLLTRKIQVYTLDYTKREITVPADLSIDMVTEHYIDPLKLTSEIVL